MSARSYEHLPHADLVRLAMAQHEVIEAERTRHEEQERAWVKGARNLRGWLAPYRQRERAARERLDALCAELWPQEQNRERT